PSWPASAPHEPPVAASHSRTTRPLPAAAKSTTAAGAGAGGSSPAGAAVNPAGGTGPRERSTPAPPPGARAHTPPPPSPPALAPPARRTPRPARQNGQPGPPAFVPGHFGLLPAGDGVPQLNRLIPAGGGQQAAVRREGDGADGPGVRLQRGPLPAGSHVPQFH